jgi:hypothetical protein
MKWLTTEKKHTKIAFNPETNKAIDITTLKVTQYKTSPVGFIIATKGKHTMPGSETPASVRVERFNEPCLHSMMVEDASEEMLIPCIAHGDYVKVEALEADHVQAKEKILARQKELVVKMNAEPKFAKFLMQQPGMNKFLVEIKGEYYGTLFFMNFTLMILIIFG